MVKKGQGGKWVSILVTPDSMALTQHKPAFLDRVSGQVENIFRTTDALRVSTYRHTKGPLQVSKQAHPQANTHARISILKQSSNHSPNHSLLQLQLQSLSLLPLSNPPLSPIFFPHTSHSFAIFTREISPIPNLPLSTAILSTIEDLFAIAAAVVVV